MGKRYAADTTVSVAKTRAEIEALVTKHKARAFGSMYQDDQAMIVFEMHDRKIMFRLKLPKIADFTRTPHRGTTRTAEQARAAWEQACRSRWRALLLSIRAKLEAVEIGLAVFDDEFMANIVMADGGTMGDRAKPLIALEYKSGQVQRLLPSPGVCQ